MATCFGSRRLELDVLSPRLDRNFLMDERSRSLLFSCQAPYGRTTRQCPRRR